MARDNGGAALRAALSTGLAAVLGEARVGAALQLWERRNAGGKPYTMIEYVNELTSTLALPARQRHELRIALYRALMERGIDPTLNTALPQAAQRPAAQQAANAPFRVFRCVVHDVLGSVRADAMGGAQLFESTLRLRAAEHGLSAGLQQALLQWIDGADDNGYFLRAAPADYAAVTHLLYVAACEALGPVATDRLFSRAIARAEALPEAAAFPPQRLL